MEAGPSVKSSTTWRTATSNAYLRLRWALTEDGTVVKPYVEKDWAKLPDASSAPVEISLNLLDALHTRWLHTLAGHERGGLRPYLEGARLRVSSGGRTWCGCTRGMGSTMWRIVTGVRGRMGW